MGILDKTLLLVALYIALFIYSAHIKWKKGKLQFFIPIVVVMVGVILLDELLIKSYIGGNTVAIVFNNALDVLVIFGCIVSMAFIKEHTRASLLFTGCASYATYSLANNIYSFILMFFAGSSGLLSGSEWSELAKNTIFFTIFAIIYVIVYTICWFLFVRKRNVEISYAVDKSVFVIFVLIFVVNIFFGSTEMGYIYGILVFNKILSCMLMLFVLFNQSKYLNSRSENMRLQYIMEQQSEQFKTAKESMNEVNVKAHDLKHFVDIFKENGAVPEEVINELDNVSKVYDSNFNTGNEALDITLTEKCREFAKNNILFSVIADGEALSFISNVDIYVLFGNIIDNAREAVAKIENKDDRIIAMYVKRTEQFISIHEENTFFEKPIFDNGMPQTSKDDKAYHGYGTKSIQQIVDKYNGTLKIDCDEKLFTIDIVFYNNLP
jgi:hypothetical protein